MCPKSGDLFDRTIEKNSRENFLQMGTFDKKYYFQITMFWGLSSFITPKLLKRLAPNLDMW
jgi:hypothetical protein